VLLGEQMNAKKQKFVSLETEVEGFKPIEEWTLEDWAEFYAGYHEGYDEEQ
jgi:hypothetical protein